jgi:hypothetical protein
MSGMQRHWICRGGAANTAEPQNLSSAVQEMRWQGPDKTGRLRASLKARLQNSKNDQFVKYQPAYDDGIDDHGSHLPRELIDFPIDKSHYAAGRRLNTCEASGFST